MDVLRVLLICLTSFCVSPAFGDTIFLKSGEVITTKVERFSDGAFWVREGKKTYILDPSDVLKIAFTQDLETLMPASSRKAAPRAPPVSSSRANLFVVPASASSFDSPPAELVILNYSARLTSGIFQVTGEVENRMDTTARYVKITVSLMDESGEIVDQNFSFVRPDPPHIDAGNKKGFRVSFLNPATGVAKYKIRVESSPF